MFTDSQFVDFQHKDSAAVVARHDTYLDEFPNPGAEADSDDENVDRVRVEVE